MYFLDYSSTDTGRRLSAVHTAIHSCVHINSLRIDKEKAHHLGHVNCNLITKFWYK